MANDVEEDGLFFRFWVSRGSTLLGKKEKKEDKKTTNLLCVRVLALYTPQLSPSDTIGKRS